MKRDLSIVLFQTIILFLLIFKLNINNSQAIVIGSEKPTCSSGQATCGKGLTPACSNEQFKPVCKSNTPTCCLSGDTSLECNPSFLSCEFMSVTNPSTTLEIEFTQNPILPDAIKLINEDSSLKRISGIAYKGSNPSFEIRFKNINKEIKVNSVDFEDSTGTVSMGITFSIFKPPQGDNIFILSLELPETISTGGGIVTLNLDDGTSPSGLIEIINLLNIEDLKNEKIGKPLITNIKTTKRNKKITLDLFGDNFAGKKILINISEEEKILYTANKNLLNTVITILPSSLKLKLKKIKISKDGKAIKAELSSTKKLEKNTIFVMVVSTPGGIVSIPIKIN